MRIKCVLQVVQVYLVGCVGASCALSVLCLRLMCIRCIVCVVHVYLVDCVRSLLMCIDWIVYVVRV
jgi:hypothetical protein